MSSYGFGSVWKGPDLPQKLQLHCAVALNSKTVLIIRGKNDRNEVSNKTFGYDFESSQWVTGPELAIGRHSHACSVYEDNQELLVYVVGGSNDNGVLDSVEFAILNQDNILTKDWYWSSGPKFPINVRYHAMVSTKYALYVIGGYSLDANAKSNGQLLDAIFELNLYSKNSTWVQLPQKLSVARADVVALALPQEATDD